MTRNRLSLEMKVGLFIVGGVGLLVFFLFTIGDLATYFSPGYAIRVVFDSAIGISRGSPVQYAGMEVGKVKAVSLLYSADQVPPKVELLIQLPRSVVVRADDSASISTFGLLGEKYLEISPGSGEGAALQSGDMLTGQPPVSTEDVIERSNEVLNQLKQTLSGINSLVGSPRRHPLLEAPGRAPQRGDVSCRGRPGQPGEIPVRRSALSGNGGLRPRHEAKPVEVARPSQKAVTSNEHTADRSMTRCAVCCVLCADWR